MSTIKDIARECNVSIATVSNILNNKPGPSHETQLRVLKVAKKLNYTPNYLAKNLKTRSTRSIGVIAEDMTIFSVPDIIDGITEYCEKKNYQILLTNLRLYKKYNDTYYDKSHYFDIVQKEINELMAKQVEGLIYVAAHERIIKCIPDNLRIPTIMAYAYSDNPKIPSVTVDDELGTYQLIKYMIDLGHKKIGVIMGNSDSLHAKARLKGYQKAIYDEGILYNPDLVYIGNFTRQGGYNCTDILLSKNVTGIFCMNDLMAGGVYDRLEELSMVAGKDISVVGYDDRELSAYYRPPLTTCMLPLHDIGYQSSKILIHLLENTPYLKNPEGIYPMVCTPLIRNSVVNLKNS